MVADSVAPDILSDILRADAPTERRESAKTRGRRLEGEGGTDKRAPQIHLLRLVQAHDWDAARSWVGQHPLDAMYVDVRSGWTPLHNICTIGSAPLEVLVDVLRARPRVAAMKDNRGDTPLHQQCRNSQRSVDKILALLRYGEIAEERETSATSAAALASIRNRSGQNALHAACENFACLPVLQALVAADPTALHETDWYGNNPLDLAWKVYTSTIPGALKVAEILSSKWNRVVEEERLEHFARFWERIRFLALEAYHHAQSDSGEAPKRDSRLLAHALLTEWYGSGRAPLQRIASPLAVALALDPTLASVPDHRGNYPLHILVGQDWHGREVRSSEASDMALLLRLFPDAALKWNANLRAPLHLAIEGGLPWAGGLELVLNSAPYLLGVQDPRTRLYPFMLAAASANGPGPGLPSVELTFQLLRADPGLVGLC